MENLFKKIKTSIDNQQGMALAVVLMVIVVFSILGVALLSVAATNTKLATINRSNQSAYYIAEAGATYELKAIRNSVNKEYPLTTDSTSFFNAVKQDLQNQGNYTFTNVNGVTPNASVQVQPLPTSDPNTMTYKILSVGTIGSQTRTVSQMVNVQYAVKQAARTIPNTTVFTTSSSSPSITLNGAHQIVGDVGTNGGAGSIKINGNNDYAISGNIYYVGTPDIANTVVKKNKNVQINTPQPIIKASVELPPYPSIPAAPLSGDGNGNLVVTSGTSSVTGSHSFNNLTVSPGATLEIDLTGNTNIIVTNWDVEGTIKISGSGSLSVFVTNQWTLGQNCVINGGGTAGSFTVYYSGVNSLALQGNINAGIYDQTASISVSNHQSQTVNVFSGPIVTGGSSFTLSGQTAAQANLIYAPNTDFTLGGGSQISAQLIASTFTTNGSTCSLTKLSTPATFSGPLFPSDWLSGTTGSSIADKVTADQLLEVK